MAGPGSGKEAAKQEAELLAEVTKSSGFWGKILSADEVEAINAGDGLIEKRHRSAQEWRLGLNSRIVYANLRF